MAIKGSSEMIQVNNISEVNIAWTYRIASQGYPRPLSTLHSPDKFLHELVAPLEKTSITPHFFFLYRKIKRPCTRGGESLRQKWHERETTGSSAQNKKDIISHVPIQPWEYASPFCQKGRRATSKLTYPWWQIWEKEDRLSVFIWCTVPRMSVGGFRKKKKKEKKKKKKRGRNLEIQRGGDNDNSDGDNDEDDEGGWWRDAPAPYTSHVVAEFTGPRGKTG